MEPYLFGIQMYRFWWGMAIAVWVFGGTLVAARAGFPRQKTIAAFVIMLTSVLAGAKLQYLWENPDQFATGSSSLLLDGYRLPGGVAVCCIVVPFSMTLLRLPLLSFLDVVVPVAGVSLAIGRLGCFFNGCCFGTTSTLPWAVEFPSGSRAATTHALLGFSNLADRSSLPVHPLQLYYMMTYLGIAIFLLAGGPSKYRGRTTHLFAVLWGWSTVLLESFRSRDVLRAQPHIQEVALAIALVGTITLMTTELRYKRSTILRGRVL